MTAVNLAEPGGEAGGIVSTGEPFLDALVARLSAQHGLDPQAVRSLGLQLLASFAGARVQAFVPVLVEKQLRDICRRRRGLGTTPVDHEESTALG
jgi:hypothetical protein